MKRDAKYIYANKDRPIGVWTEGGQVYFGFYPKRARKATVIVMDYDTAADAASLLEDETPDYSKKYAEFWGD